MYQPRSSNQLRAPSRPASAATLRKPTSPSAGQVGEAAVDVLGHAAPRAVEPGGEVAERVGARGGEAVLDDDRRSRAPHRRPDPGPAQDLGLGIGQRGLGERLDRQRVVVGGEDQRVEPAGIERRAGIERGIEVLAEIRLADARGRARAAPPPAAAAARRRRWSRCRPARRCSRRRSRGQVSGGQRPSRRAAEAQVLKLGARSTTGISQLAAAAGRPASRCARASRTQSPPRGTSLRCAASSSTLEAASKRRAARCSLPSCLSATRSRCMCVTTWLPSEPASA